MNKRHLLLALIGLLLLALPSFAQGPTDSFTVGPLKLEMPESAALEILGEPEQKTEAVFEQATALYIKQWLYPEKGFGLILASQEQAGPFAIQTIMLEEPCEWEAVSGLRIGMDQAEAQSRVKALLGDGVTVFDIGHEDDLGVLFEKTYTVLSVRSIDGKVKHLYLGPGPE